MGGGGSGVLSAAAWGPIVSRVEQPAYTVAESAWAIEIRDYAFTLASLPKPNSAAVKLCAVKGRHFAVLRFSGTGNKKSLETHERELRAFLKGKNLQLLSPVTYAFYNPPWTLPFLRRNEIMLEIQK